MPTYSGGLGVLAGDIVKSSADLRLQMVAITLVSRKGYFMQKITEQGEQLELTEEWDPAKTLTRMPNTVTVTIEGRQVKVQAWLYEHQSPTGGMVPILFLDTDVDGNTPEDRRITDFLYGGRQSLQTETRNRSGYRRHKNPKRSAIQNQKVPHE